MWWPSRSEEGSEESGTDDSSSPWLDTASDSDDGSENSEEGSDESGSDDSSSSLLESASDSDEGSEANSSDASSSATSLDARLEAARCAALPKEQDVFSDADDEEAPLGIGDVVQVFK